MIVRTRVVFSGSGGSSDPDIMSLYPARLAYLKLTSPSDHFRRLDNLSHVKNRQSISVMHNESNLEAGMAWLVSKSKIITPPNARLEWLTPVFEKGLERVIVEFIDSEEEPAFWYNETARVSMLVAAAARFGYVTLADYETRKTGRKGRKKSDRPGRCDLYIGGNEDCGDEDWLKFEAKLQWVGTKTSAKTIENRLKKCVREEAARLLPKKERRQHVGLVFAVIDLTKEEAENCDAKVFQQFDRKLSEVKSDFCWRWYDSSFPTYSWKWKKTYTDDEYSKDDRFHPAIAIFLGLAQP